jgi:outer membrane protein assembly factor BamB
MPEEGDRMGRLQRAVTAAGGAVAVLLLSGAATGAAAGMAGGWTTFHGAASRAGSAPEPGAAATRDWRSPQLDGAVYAEPLWQGDRVYVATENNTVYALSLTTGRIVWQRHLAAPVPLDQLPCGDINPLGITGTPVIVGGRLYAVAEVEPGRQVLYTLSVATGAVLGRRDIDPPGSHSRYQQERGALAAEGAAVYVPLGGLAGDCGPYHGYVVGAESGRRLFWYRAPAKREAGIWATAGPVVDSAHDLLVATGNGSSTTAFDHGDSVIELTPTLHPVAFFAPSDWAVLNRDDLDLGSTSPALLPDGLAVQVGKSGTAYLLRLDHLGGVGGQVADLKVCSGAYGSDAVAGDVVYLPCDNALTAIAVQTGSHPSLRLLWQGPALDSGAPVVAGDTVWAVDLTHATLLAYDAANGRVLQTLPLGAVEHFETPTLAPGRILVGAGDRILAFRLRAR